jgi:GNAT superfamily N-acetyltransferase
MTLYETGTLTGSPVLPSIRQMVNDSFRVSHTEYDILANVNRLQSDDQFAMELGAVPGTFTYLLAYASSDEKGVLATASAQRYHGTPAVITGLDTTQKKTFKRYGDASLTDEEWELRLMAVRPSLQRQGIAKFLMQRIEDEVRRRFLEARRADGQQQGLVMLLTTLKEINEVFYAKRGYVVDSEAQYDKGYMGSEMGFGVVHMSKRLEL